MAVTTIPWGDGSGDNIYLTYSASQGDQTVLVSSDANNGAARQKVITFLTTVGNVSRSLTVSQEEGASLVSITWNNVCITYDDTAIGYQDTSPQYVQDGLVFWLDGIDKGEGADTWVEKKQGYVFTNHGAVFNPDHVYLDGTAYLENATASTPTVADGTIEVVYERETGSGTVFVPTRPASNSYCGFLFSSDQIRWAVFSSSQRYTIPNSPYLASVSLSADRSLGNGYELTQGSNSYIGESNGKPAYVGVLNGTGTYYTGKIYCIRVYNRKLTEAEVLANYAVDCQRFNLDWKEYITFEDPAVEQICVSTWGDGTGLTKGRAKLITAAQTQAAFQGNTEIEKFNEFRYFGLGTFGSYGGMFQNCTALTELTLPDIFSGNLLTNCFGGDTLLATLNLGNGKPAYQQGSNPNFNYIVNVKIKDIDQFIDLQRNVTAFAWASLFARYESSGAHLILAETNQEITSVNFPSGRTVVPWTCFNNMKSITSITLPSSVTEIKGYAFYGCSGLTSLPSLANLTAIGASAFNGCSGVTGDITVPSTVTSMGGYLFQGMNGITNLTINTTIAITTQTISNTTDESSCGDGTGVFYCAGNLSNGSNYRACFRKYIIGGNYSITGASAGGWRVRVINGQWPAEVFVIKGNYSTLGNNAGNSRPIAHAVSATSNWAFLEIMGTITSSYGILGNANNANNIIDGFIMHLGYDAYTNGAVVCTPTIADAGLSRVAKIYVGKGQSATEDNNILSVYTNDANWSAYTDKLDTWYNYINDPNANPDYIN